MAKSNEKNVIYLKDYSPANYSVESLDLNFDLFEKETMVTSVSKYSFNTSAK
jgi:aminopeptidase N